MEMGAPRPPTLNFLDPCQRSRLLKSSRKIEYILGATPHVLESSDIPADKHVSDTKKRQHHHHQHHHRYHHHRPTRLELSPVSPSTTDESSPNDHTTSPLPSPLPLTICIPVPPARSRLPEPLDHDEDGPTPKERVFRKQMAKLTRLLGENIPPELVRCQARSNPLPLQSDKSSVHSSTPDFRRQVSEGDSSARRERRPSRVGSRPSSSHSHHPPPPAHNHHYQHQDQHRHAPSSSSASPPTKFDLAFATSTSPPPPLSLPISPQRVDKRRPVNDLYQPPLSATSLGSSHRSNKSNGSLSTGSGRSPPHSATYPLLAPDQCEGRWNGEWNIKDMDKRAVALRNLKSR